MIFREACPEWSEKKVEFWRIIFPALFSECQRQKNERGSFPAAHLRFFSSFLSFFLASWLPAAACFESSSALAFFTWFSFTICFLLVGIQSPRYAFGGFYLAFFLLKISLYWGYWVWYIFKHPLEKIQVAISYTFKIWVLEIRTISEKVLLGRFPVFFLILKIRLVDILTIPKKKD